MSEHLNRPLESVEQETKDDQILSGEQLLRSIAEPELPPDHHFSAEQRHLFSTVSSMDDQSNFPVSPEAHNKAIFTSLGLEYGNRRYPFTKQYRALVHHAVLSLIANEVKAPDKFIAYLETKNRDWQKLLEESLWKPARSTAMKTYYSEMSEKASEVKKNTHAKVLWKTYENGPISATLQKSIIDEAKRLYRKYGPEGKIKQAANDYAASQGVELSSARASALRRQYPGYIEAIDRSKEKTDQYAEGITKALSDYIDSIGRGEAQKFEAQPNNKNGQFIHELITNKIKNREINISTEEAERLLYSRLFSGIDIHEDSSIKQLQEMINNAGRKATQFYGTTIPELTSYRGSKEYYEAELYRIRDERQRSVESKLDIVDDLSKKEVHSNISKFKTRVAEVIFPSIKAEDIYLLPTGAVARDSSGNLFSKEFSPLSERILALFPDEAIQTAWQSIWAKHAHDYDIPVRAFLEQDCKSNASNADLLDHKLSELSKRFQIDYPAPISVQTGCVSESVQPDDYELLKKLLPTIGGFVDGISLLPPEENISLKSTRLEIIAFLSGDREVETSQLFGDGRKLKLRALETLLIDAGPEKKEKVMARLIPELGMSVFHSLDKETRARFSQLVGPNSNVSRTEFYRIYHRSVPNPKLRRSLAERTLFINEFQKYLKGTSTMSSFFDDIKKKPVISDDISSKNNTNVL